MRSVLEIVFMQAVVCFPSVCAICIFLKTWIAALMCHLVEIVLTYVPKTVKELSIVGFNIFNAVQNQKLHKILDLLGRHPTHVHLQLFSFGSVLNCLHLQSTGTCSTLSNYTDLFKH